MYNLSNLCNLSNLDNLNDLSGLCNLDNLLVYNVRGAMPASSRLYTAAVSGWLQAGKAAYRTIPTTGVRIMA